MDNSDVIIAAQSIWDLYLRADGATFNLHSGSLAGEIFMPFLFTETEHSKLKKQTFQQRLLRHSFKRVGICLLNLKTQWASGFLRTKAKSIWTSQLLCRIVRPHLSWRESIKNWQSAICRI